MNTSIWVGEIEGKPVVYDPAIQLQDCPHLFLWDPNSLQMGKYIASIIRKRIQPHKEPGVADEHVAAYLRWYKEVGLTWLHQELPYYESRRESDAQQKEAERVANLSLEEKHKERLKRLNREYRGVRPAKLDALRRRVTHCYACQQDLDNSVDIECIACGWILCSCGACGCGYAGL